MNTFYVFPIFTIVTIANGFFCPTQFVPDQIRLAFAGDTGVSVGWHTYACSFDTSNPNPNATVIYGFSRAALTFTSVNRNSSFYDKSNILKTSWFYSVELLNLIPSTVYYYQIVRYNYVSASAILSFTSAPPLGSQSRPINITAYGDMGVDGTIATILNGPLLFERSLAALQTILSSVDFFIHHGDICYADDIPLIKYLSFEKAYDDCQTKMANITSARFYMTAVGNHEINCTTVPGVSETCPSYEKNQIPYTHRFHMPSKQSGGYLNSWYSFNYGFVHVISLSCESDFPGAPSGNLLDSTTQVNWLNNDLANVNRAVTPWIIVQCHRPWKGSKSVSNELENGIYNCPSCKTAFEAILIQYNVDIYIAGHVHWYERICLNGTVNTTEYINPNGPVYLTNGAIGNPEGNDYVATRSTDSCIIINDPGFGILTLWNASQATFTFYRTSDMHPLDRINIIKNR